jgi:hypothetical protein
MMDAKTLKKKAIVTRILGRLRFLKGPVATVVLLLCLLRPGLGLCDLYLQFLVDRSGSMWSAYRGKAKIVQVAKAIDRVAKELPPEVAMGLRVYPPPEKHARGPDPGLRIPLEADNRSRFAGEYQRFNPRGMGSLRDMLGKALKDFPEGEDTKLLVLLCDGADTRGVSFCEKEVKTARPEGLRFYAVSLNLKDPADQEELDCLSKQMGGRSIHLTPKNDLSTTLLPIARQAYQDEVERQRRVVEEEKRIQALLSKTRLKVEFQNTLDPFFADVIQVEQCLLDGEEVSIDTSVRLAQGEGFLLFDRAMAEGAHQLSLRYKKWKDDKAVPSVEGILEVVVEEGRTSHVECYPRGALFHWDVAFKARTF